MFFNRRNVISDRLFVWMRFSATQFNRFPTTLASGVQSLLKPALTHLHGAVKQNQIVLGALRAP